LQVVGASLFYLRLKKPPKDHLFILNPSEKLKAG